MTDASKTTLGDLTSRHLGMTVILREQGDGVTLTRGGPMSLRSIAHEDRAVTLRGDGRQMIYGPAVTPCEVLAPEEATRESVDDRRLVRVGGIAVGIVTARETLLDGTIVYEVDPFPMWRMAPHPREEITS